MCQSTLWQHPSLASISLFGHFGWNDLHHGMAITWEASSPDTPDAQKPQSSSSIQRDRREKKNLIFSLTRFLVSARSLSLFSPLFCKKKNKKKEKKIFGAWAEKAWWCNSQVAAGGTIMHREQSTGAAAWGAYRRERAVLMPVSPSGPIMQHLVYDPANILPVPLELLHKFFIH